MTEKCCLNPINSYWNETGMYQAEANQLEKDIPREGHAKLTTVELFRCASNIYYDIMNNGGCNICPRDTGEFSKYTQLMFLKNVGIEVGKIIELANLKETEDERDIDTYGYDSSESDELWETITTHGGYCDQMMDEVIMKCHELGYKFKEGELV